ncbi:MAG: NAD(P)H-dependent oxidoreductase [Gammaproteobacteria bacterium]|nr:NAD(P)H-dependent oxidoreductase [Gammaproteobacteria bacterium]
MPKRIVLIQGHPDLDGGHFCHALADAYVKGADEAGHDVRGIEVAKLEFPLLRTKKDFETGVVPDAINRAQHTIKWAEHLVIIYPLWLGTMPALLKAFFEQAFRPEFAFETKSKGLWKKLLKGRSARIVITMGMPGFFYRWYFRAHSLKSLERNILGFCGIGPIKEALIGLVETANDAKHNRWLEKMHELGRRGR